MGRRGVAWVVSFACAALGGLLAHALTYRLIDANAGHAGPLHSGSHHHHGDAAVSAASGGSHWTICFAIFLPVAALARLLLQAASVADPRGGADET